MTGRLGKVQGALDAMVREHPERAARWYVVARLLLQDDAEARYRQIQEGLAPLGEARQRAFRETVQRLEARRRLERFLSQVRASRSRDNAQRATCVRARLRWFLEQIHAYKQAKDRSPSQTAPLYRLERSPDDDATAQGVQPCPTPP